MAAGSQGREVETKSKLDTVAVQNWVKSIIDADNRQGVHRRRRIGAGASTCTRLGLLRSRFWRSHIVRSIDFGGAPQQTEILYSQADGKPMAPPRNSEPRCGCARVNGLEEPGGADIPDKDPCRLTPVRRHTPTICIALADREQRAHARARRALADEMDAVASPFPACAGEIAPRTRTRARALMGG